MTARRSGPPPELAKLKNDAVEYLDKCRTRKERSEWITAVLDYAYKLGEIDGGQQVEKILNRPTS